METLTLSRGQAEFSVAFPRVSDPQSRDGTFPPGAFSGHEVGVMHPWKLPVRYTSSPRKTAL